MTFLQSCSFCNCYLLFLSLFNQFRYNYFVIYITCASNYSLGVYTYLHSLLSYFISGRIFEFSPTVRRQGQGHLKIKSSKSVATKFQTRWLMFLGSLSPNPGSVWPHDRGVKVIWMSFEGKIVKISGNLVSDTKLMFLGSLSPYTEIS